MENRTIHSIHKVSWVFIYLLLICILTFFSIWVASHLQENILLFYIFLFLSVSFIPQLLKVYLKKFDVFSIDFFFVAAFSLYSLSEPIRVLLNLSPYKDSYITTMQLQITAVISFYLGILFVYIFRLTAKNRDNIFGLKILSAEFRSYNALVLLILGILMFSIYFITIGGFKDISKMEMSLMKSNNSWVTSFAFGMKFIVVALLYLFVESLNKYKKIKVRFLVAFFIFFSTFMEIGERGEIFALIVAFVIIFNYKIKRISAPIFLSMSVIGYLGLQTMNHLKNQNILEMWTTLKTEIDVGWYINLEGEFQTAARNLGVLTTDFNERFNYLWGETFLAVITNFVPASIWPSRPTNAVGWFNQNYNASLLDSGGGRGFSLVGEGYINAGITGVFLLFISIGIVGAIIYNKVNKGDSDFWILSYALLLPVLIYSFRADLSTLVGQFLKGGLIPLCFIYLFSYSRRVKYEKD